MTPEFLFFSDLHAQFGAWRRRRSLYGDSLFAWRQIVDWACGGLRPDGRPLAAVFDGGDLLDEAVPDDFVLKALFAGLDRLQAAGVPYYYVRGNHDVQAGRRHDHVAQLAAQLGLKDVPPSLLGLHPWPTHLHDRLVELGDKESGVFTVRGLDYQPPDQVKAVLRALPKCDVLLTHQVWTELVRHSGEASLSDLPFRVEVWTGDYHEHFTKVFGSDTLTSHSVKVYSPGSMAMQDVAEDPVKAVWVGDYSGGMASQVLRSRPCHRVVVGSAADLPAVKALAVPDPDLPPPVRTPILKVVVAADVPGLVPALEADLAGKAHLFWEFPGPAARPAASPGPRPAGLTVEEAVALAAEASPAAREAVPLALAVWGAADPEGEAARLAAAALEGGDPCSTS